MEHRSLASMAKDRALRRGAFPWVVSGLVALNVAAAVAGAALRAERSANLLVATGGTVDAEGRLAPDLVAGARWDRSVGENLDLFWGQVPDARRTRLAVLSGMSQMYAINDVRRGDRTISEVLDDELGGSGVRVFGLAAPNLCNEEEFLLFLAAASEERTRPAVWIYGVCFDKFRNVDLRPGYQAFLRRRPALAEAWAEAASRYATSLPNASRKMDESLREARRSGEDESDTLEGRLRRLTGRLSPLVASRQEINVEIQLDVYKLRNRVLGIRPTSKRPALPYRYDLNREFLGMLAAEAARRDVRLILYVIPLNPLSENPYVPEEYAAFKSWLTSFARQRGIPFADLENVVPSEHWGEFMGGPDFKHFRAEGHRLTAQAILQKFRTEIVGAPVATAAR